MEGCASTSFEDTSSLMLILIAVIIIGLTIFALVACLPLLMGITLVHIFRSHDDAVDSSIIFTKTKDTQDLDPHQHITTLKGS